MVSKSLLRVSCLMRGNHQATARKNGHSKIFENTEQYNTLLLGVLRVTCRVTRNLKR